MIFIRKDGDMLEDRNTVALSRLRTEMCGKLPLGETTCSIVRATLPTLRDNEAVLVGEIYLRIKRNPHESALLEQLEGGSANSQIREIVRTILAGAAGLVGDEAPLLPIEHYAYMAKALIGAIAKLLGDEASQEVLNAWDEVLRVGAHLFLTNGSLF